MNTQFAELIQEQKSLVAEKAQKLADAQTELAAANTVLEELIKSEQLCSMASAAQQKIQEGKQELEKAIALMPPEIAAMWQGTTTPEEPKPGDPAKPEPKPGAPAEPEPTKPAKKQPAKVSDKEIDKAIAYIQAGKHISNVTGLLRYRTQVLEKAAARVGVEVVDKMTKHDIAEAIATALHPVPPAMTPPFQPGDMVQNSTGDVGKVVDCIKKDGGGESVSDISTSEQSIPSGSPPPDSSDIPTVTNIEPPVNGEVMIPDDILEAS